MTHPHLKFDAAKLERLNDPGRFDSLPPQKMWDALDVAAESTIIEIGAGTGMFASAFTRIHPALRVFATDIEPVMIEWMREHLPEVLEGRIVPLLAEESRVPLDDEMVDGAYMINLHHELADPDASYRETARLLKPGGRILVVDWLDRETPKGPPMQVRASSDRLREHLLAAGFDDIEIHASLEMHSMLSATKPEDSGV